MVVRILDPPREVARRVSSAHLDARRADVRRRGRAERFKQINETKVAEHERHGECARAKALFKVRAKVRWRGDCERASFARRQRGGDEGSVAQRAARSSRRYAAAAQQAVDATEAQQREPFERVARNAQLQLGATRRSLLHLRRRGRTRRTRTARLRHAVSSGRNDRAPDQRTLEALCGEARDVAHDKGRGWGMRHAPALEERRRKLVRGGWQNNRAAPRDRAVDVQAQRDLFRAPEPRRGRHHGTRAFAYVRRGAIIVPIGGDPSAPRGVPSAVPSGVPSEAHPAAALRRTERLSIRSALLGAKVASKALLRRAQHAPTLRAGPRRRGGVRLRPPLRRHVRRRVTATRRVVRVVVVARPRKAVVTVLLVQLFEQTRRAPSAAAAAPPRFAFGAAVALPLLLVASPRIA